MEGLEIWYVTMWLSGKEIRRGIPSESDPFEDQDIVDKEYIGVK